MPPHAASDPLIGSVFERRYEIIAALGSGGMGTVYLAEDTRLKRRYALKVLRSDLAMSREFVDRFLREAQTIAQLRHPNIIDIHSFGEDSGWVFFTMELLAGEDLDGRIAARDVRPYSVTEACAWAIQLARAVAAVHDAGLIHRDLKPANAFLARQAGGESVVKLLDFGIARPEASSELTRTGVALGTPSHMSPEQCRSEKLDRRSDIYSFGVLLFKLVTGRLPFLGDAIQVATQHCLSLAPAPSSLAPVAEIPPALDALILKLMAKEADNRPTSMHEVEQALVAIHDEMRSRPAPIAAPLGATPAAVGGHTQPALAFAETLAVRTDEVPTVTQVRARPPAPDVTPIQSPRPQDTHSGAPSAPSDSALAAAPAAMLAMPRRPLLRLALAGIVSALALLALVMTMGDPFGGPSPAESRPESAAKEPPSVASIPPPQPEPVPETAPAPVPEASPPEPEPEPEPEPAVEPERPPDTRPQPTKKQNKPKPPQPKPQPDVAAPAPSPPPAAEKPKYLVDLHQRARACRKTHSVEGGAPVSILYTTTADGAVTDVETTDTTKVAKCLVKAVQQTRFEPKVRLRQPIKL